MSARPAPTQPGPRTRTRPGGRTGRRHLPLGPLGPLSRVALGGVGLALALAACSSAAPQLPAPETTAEARPDGTAAHGAPDETGEAGAGDQAVTEPDGSGPAAGETADGTDGAEGADDEDPQDPPPTADPVVDPAAVPAGAVEVAAGAEHDCTGLDVVVTQGLQQVTLVGACRSVTVNATDVDLVGESTAALVVAGDRSVVRFGSVTGTVTISGAGNVVTAPTARSVEDEGTDNVLH